MNDSNRPLDSSTDPAVPPEVDPEPHIFRGTVEKCDDFAYVKVFMESDTDGTLQILFALDGHHWFVGGTLNYESPAIGSLIVPVQGRYYHILYTNGPVAQTYFRLQSLLCQAVPCQFTTDSISVHPAPETIFPVQFARPSLGEYGNLANEIDIAIGASGPVLDVSDFGECLISYRDTSPNTTSVLLYGSIDGTAFFPIGALQPVATVFGERIAFSRLYLHGINYMQIANNSMMDQLTGVSCTLVG